MRTFVITSYETYDGLSLVEVPVPDVGKGQVRIRIEATGLGFVDGLMVRGRYQIRPDLPYVPGGEIAGLVDAVGDGVETLRVGDKVATWQLGGGLAEFAVVPAASVHVVPAGVSSSVAAAMLVDYQTAHHGLFDRGRVRASDTVLVLGATGGVGSAAVQLAARTGATVIAGASTPEKRDLAIALGASDTVDYLSPQWRAELKSKAPGGVVDVVVDPVGGEMFEPAFRSLGKEGRYLVIGFAGGAVPKLPVNLALLKSATLMGVEIRHFLHTQPERAQRVLSALYMLVSTGALKPPRIASFDFEQSNEAIAATMSREKQGKVVVRLLGDA